MMDPSKKSNQLGYQLSFEFYEPISRIQREPMAPRANYSTLVRQFRRGDSRNTNPISFQITTFVKIHLNARILRKISNQFKQSYKKEKTGKYESRIYIHMVKHYRYHGLLGVLRIGAGVEVE